MRLKLHLYDDSMDQDIVISFNSSSPNSNNGRYLRRRSNAIGCTKFD